MRRHRLLIAFGCNEWGQLGNDSMRMRSLLPVVLAPPSPPSPSPFPPLWDPLTSVACGHYHSLVSTWMCREEETNRIRYGANLYAWGASGDGQLGPIEKESHRETCVERITPWRRERVGDDSEVGRSEMEVRILACGRFHSVASDARHRLWTWGRIASENSIFHLGRNRFDHENKEICTTPISISLPLEPSDSISHVDCGWGHTVVITRNGRVFGFGLNREGQLGLSISDQSVVVEPRELTVSSVLSEQHFGEKLHPIQVSCGLDHTLIVCDDGRVFAAGLNEQGQLGIGRCTQVESSWIHVPIHARIKQSACGWSHSLLLDDEGKLYSSGWNEGGLGYITPERQTSSFRRVDLQGHTCVDMAAGRVHSVAVVADGSAFVWGSGRGGRLGLGDGQDYFEPTLFDSLPDVTDDYEFFACRAAYAGLDHTILEYECIR